MSDIEPNTLVPAIAAIAGAFVGSVTTIIPTLITGWFGRRRETIQIQAALLAEIGALVEIAEERKYLRGLENARKYLEQQPSGSTHCLAVRIPEHYSRIYQANAERIGLMKPELARKIVHFHQFVDAIVQDVTPGGPLAEGCELEGFVEAEKILRRALEIGREVSSDNQSFQPTPLRG